MLLLIVFLSLIVWAVFDYFDVIGIIAKDEAGVISTTGIGGAALMGAIAAAMVGSIFSSDAWNNVTFIAGEMKNPKRNVGLSLFACLVVIKLA